MKGFVHFDFVRFGLVADATAPLRCVRIQKQCLVANVTDKIQCLIWSATDHANAAGQLKAFLKAINVDWIHFGQTEPKRYDQQ